MVVIGISLAFRRPARVYQHTSEEFEARIVQFAQFAMILAQVNRISNLNFIRMDENAVYFVCNHNSSVNVRVSKIKFARIASIAN